METTFSDDLRRYLSLLWHWAWLLILAAVLAAAAAYVVSSRTIPVYQTSTLLLVSQGQNARTDDYSSLVTAERLAKTYTELLVSQPVLEGVVERLGLELDPRILGDMVSAAPVRDTQLIRVTVRHIQPALAALVANALAIEFSEQNLSLQHERYAASRQTLEAQLATLDEQIAFTTERLEAEEAAMTGGAGNSTERDRLEALLVQNQGTRANLLASYETIRLAEAQSLSNITQVEAASVPAHPVLPRTLQNTLLAAVVGLMAAVGLVFLLEAMDDTIKSPEEVARLLELPVLGVIARHKKLSGLPEAADHPRSPISEAYRALRSNIQFASVDQPLRTLLVTSPSPEDGKTTVAANLAVSLAQDGRKVVLIDADLRKPQIHQHLCLPNQEGVSSLFVKPDAHLNGQLQRTEISGLWAITTGRLPPNPAELVGSERMSTILEKIKRHVDLVVLDTPPLMAVTDAAVLAPRVDGVLLVIKPGATRLSACQHSVEQLRRAGANILGVVLNDVNMRSARYRYSYYRSYYNSYYKKYGSEENAQPEPEPGPLTQVED